VAEDLQKSAQEQADHCSSHIVIRMKTRCSKDSCSGVGGGMPTVSLSHFLCLFLCAVVAKAKLKTKAICPQKEIAHRVIKLKLDREELNCLEVM